jgi:hypothetical protein
VRRRVLVQAEVFEKGFEVFSNHVMQVLERALRNREVAVLLALDRAVPARDQAEGDVRRYVVFRIGVRRVIGQRSQRRRARRRRRLSPSASAAALRPAMSPDAATRRSPRRPTSGRRKEIPASASATSRAARSGR